MSTEDKHENFKRAALDIAEAPLTLDAKLSWHISMMNNEVRDWAIPMLREAILIARAGGDLDTMIATPPESRFKPELSVHRILDGFYLNVYVDAALNATELPAIK